MRFKLARGIEMNTTQISPSVESHTEEPLWQEFTEQEQEKICGGAKLKGAYYIHRWEGFNLYRITIGIFSDKTCRPIGKKRVFPG